MPPHSDLVQEAKLDTVIFSNHTQHTFYRRGKSGSRGRVKIVEQWKRQRYLGNGAYGTVWLESCDRPASQDGPKCRAVKEIPTRISKSNDVDYSRELEAITKFSQHRYTPFFVQSYGWFETPEAIFITMEYMEKGDLESYLKHSIVEEEAKTIAFQLAQGLQYMHMNGFTHRDLKPKNILVVFTGPDWLVQISDFGISRRLRPDQLTLGTISRGTLGFVAPEMLGLVEERDYPHAVDIWSLGAVIYRMLTTELFLGEYIRLIEYVAGKRSLPSQDLDSCSATHCVKDLLGKLLAPSPSKRPSATDILKHDWFGTKFEVEETTEISSYVEIEAALVELETHAETMKTASEAPSATWTTDITPDRATASLQTHQSRLEPNPGVNIIASHPKSPTGITEWRSRDDDSNTTGGKRTTRSAFKSLPSTTGIISMNGSSVKRATSLTLQGDYDHYGFKFAFRGNSNTIRPECINQINESAESFLPGTLLHWATRQGYLEDVKTLVNAGADIAATQVMGWTPFHVAVASNHTAIVEVLLDNGADIEARTEGEMTALYLASFSGKIEAVKILLSNRADVRARCSDGQTALYAASSRSHISTFRTNFGMYTGEFDIFLSKPLPASRECCPEVVKLLLEAGADTEDGDHRGWTPLHEASDSGYTEVAELLLRAGADTKARDRRGSTPLHQASTNGHTEVVKLLIEAGADVEASDRHLRTPLYQASDQGHKQVVKLLLEAGADTEVTDRNGNTALHRASKGGHLEALRLIVKAGACPFLENRMGETPRDLAQKGPKFHGIGRTLSGPWP